MFAGETYVTLASIAGGSHLAKAQADDDHQHIAQALKHGGLLECLGQFICLWGVNQRRICAALSKAALEQLHRASP